MNINLNHRETAFDLLRNNSLFNTASDQAILSLLENSKIDYLKKGEFIIDVEKTLYKFYCITKGKIKVFKFNDDSERQFALFILSKNDVFDVFTLIDHHKHIVYYEVLEDTELLIFSVENIRVWLNYNPSMLNSFFKYTINKFELLETRILDLGTNGLTIRLANLLLHNYNINSKQIENINNLSHDELAQFIGTTRAVFNKHIQILKENGIIRIRRKNIEVLNLELLIEKSHNGNFIN